MRNLQRSYVGTALLALFALLAGCVPQTSAQPQIKRLTLPPGFQISVFSDKVPGARQMVLDEKGTLFVGSIIPNTVYALPDRNHDGKADEVITVASNLNHPNGVAVRNGALYIGEIPKITRYDDIEGQLSKPADAKGARAFTSKVVTDKLPNVEWHGYRYIRFGPDDLLYFGVGAPCNVCEKPDERFGSLMRMKPDGSNLEIFAKGIRNTVGFDWHPETKQVWFTDNGRDYLGDNLPPDELNCAPEKGMHFGFPYRYGSNVPDPEFGVKAPKGLKFTPPAMSLAPHVASLGMRFYTGDMFPAKYKGNVFIAEHGSWNRDKKIGYRIQMVTVENGKGTKYETFLSGFHQGDEAWGRPVDLCMMPDGSMLVSDDRCGAIYRISYAGNRAESTVKPN